MNTRYYEQLIQLTSVTSTIGVQFEFSLDKASRGNEIILINFASANVDKPY